MYLLLVITREGGLSDQHLKDEHTKTPPINSSCVGGLSQHLRRTESKLTDDQGIHLWRQELRCSTEGAGSITISHPLLAQTEVCNLDVAFRVQ